MRLHGAAGGRAGGPVCPARPGLPGAAGRGRLTAGEAAVPLPISRGRSSRRRRHPTHRARAPPSPAGSGSGRRQAREPEPLSAVGCCRRPSPPARWRPRRFPRCRRSSRASSTICEPRRSWTSASRWWRTTVSEAAAAPARPVASRLALPPLPAATSLRTGRSVPLPVSAWLFGLRGVPVGCTEKWGGGEAPPLGAVRGVHGLPCLPLQLRAPTRLPCALVL